MDTALKHDFVERDSKSGAGPVTLFKRPTAKTGLVGWLTTVDHKKIGILYGVSAVFFLLVGGLEALFIRIQLMVPNNDFLSAETYNQMFTMHGTTMIFLAVMPLSAAFFNYMTPLMIGARDVAFPRLNSFSFWTFLAGAIILNLSWLPMLAPEGYRGIGQAPAMGWFAYANLTSSAYTPGLGTDFWIVGLQLLGVASVVAALNFIVTIINLRAPGMTMMRLPVFVWMTLVTSFLIILAFPAITIALVELMFDRLFGTNFFEVAKGGQPILWQHLFWVFGHPEVYILILPAMGIISEILPTFSRKPLFGYPIIVFSGAVIGFLGFAVWSHHMFTTGLGKVANTAFALATMTIAVPTGVKIFNWIGTMWGGRIRFSTPMVYALGFIWMFMMGGFTGIMHSAAPADAQQQDSYFVVAHFHYVLIGGSIFSLLAGLYYWVPKMSGRMASEGPGKIGFWMVFAGFNIAFFPMHFLGLNGMPRRIYTYDGNLDWNLWNYVSTLGALLLGAGVGFVVIHLVYSIFKGKPAGGDPWNGRTLEWDLPSPPPEYNFAAIPVVRARDAHWHEKHAKTPAPSSPSAEHEREHGVHMPDQSWFPALASLGMFILGLGMIFKNQTAGMFGHWSVVPIVGASVLFLGAYLWALEGPAGYHVHPEGDDGHGHGRAATKH
ncbi:cytochrome c oxidase subunit I [Opitutales bacterium ASA1]|uniref:cytochrome c oxidase subunit I n=1 Tax=Congregicoccus parvus TaxID=3081749 RepID=UPI002B2F3A1D|nr:cytochrome c oxidase subunit I [Opitutales bacterium ASA1]